MKKSIQRNGLRLAFALWSAQMSSIAVWSDEPATDWGNHLVSQSHARNAPASTKLVVHRLPPSGQAGGQAGDRSAVDGMAWNNAAQEQVLGDQQWWLDPVSQPLLSAEKWVTFDLPTVLVDALINSPRIQAVNSGASIRFEEIIQQDAAFDSRVVLEGGYGLTNDPVGNTLVTGGPPRLRERSFTLNGGLQRNTRSGATLDLSQELGILASNSQFFEPEDQGNARLNLSLTQPLMAGRGRVVTERLLVQARIDGRNSWQEMRGEVTDHLAEVMSVFLQLHEQRSHLVQQRSLVERGGQIETIVQGRQEFDVGRLEIVKLRQRRSTRQNRLVQDSAAIKRSQARLKALVGSETLDAAIETTEMIPTPVLDVPTVTIELADALRTGMENRPDVKSAMTELESAALGIRVTKNQLLPRLDAILNGYLAGLNGRNQVFRSFGDQFYESGPGISALLQYEMPRGNRNARSRHRAAIFQYRQASAQLQQTIQQVHLEVENALVRLEAADQLRHRQSETLRLAVEEEHILTGRYAMLGPDGGTAGVVLENLLDSQQRRTDAERTLVTAQVDYQLALIELQRAMGTLLTNEGIQPVRANCSNQIEWISGLPTTDATSSHSVAAGFAVYEDDGQVVGGRIEELNAPLRDDLNDLEMIEVEVPMSSQPESVPLMASPVNSPVTTEGFTP